MSEAPDTEVIAPEGQTDEPQTAERDYEAEAREGGWKPEDQFDGKGKWIDAEAFVKRGEEFLPFLKADRDRLAKAVKEMTKHKRDTDKVIADMHGLMTQTQQRAYDRARRDLEAEQAEAVANNDVDRVREITKDITDLTAEAAAKTAPPVDPNAPDPEYIEARDNWIAANPWFNTKQGLTVFAIDVDRRLAGQGMDAIERLAEVTKRVKAEFPSEFQNAARNGAPMTDGGGNGGGARRQGGKGWNDLPPEAKAFAERLIANPKMKMTKERYAKEYAW